MALACIVGLALHQSNIKQRIVGLLPITVSPSLSCKAMQSNDQPSEPSEPNTKPKRCIQGKFDKDERDFLEPYLPVYWDLFGGGSKKGDKKEWVEENIYPKFVKRFNSEGPTGPDLDSLQKVSPGGRFFPGSLIF